MGGDEFFERGVSGGYYAEGGEEEVVVGDWEGAETEVCGEGVELEEESAWRHRAGREGRDYIEECDIVD